MELADIIREFISVVLANKKGAGVDKYRPILIHAGFTQVATIVQGKSVGQYRDQDGSSTGKVYSRNGDSGLVVMCDRGEDQLATLWLDSIWRYIQDKGGQMTSEVLAMEVKQFVEASVPLEPIVLTEFGEALREYPPEQRGIYTVHTRDDHPFRDSPGVHELCGGWVDLRIASPAYSALVCRTCQLRVVIPNSIDTYGGLRAHFPEFNPR